VFKDKTVDQVFAEEKDNLLTLPAAPFDGYQESTVRVSSQLLIGFDRNRYSVDAMAVGKTVSLRAYANRLVMSMDGSEVGTHQRHFGRDKVIYDPWHYVAVLERKPGALRNGAPFKQWDLPEAMSEVRTILEGRSGGDRQFVGILAVVSRYGLEPVAAACTQALTDKTISGDVILSILSRTHDAPQTEPVPSEYLPLLTLIPVVDCSRYDRLLLGGVHGTS